MAGRLWGYNNTKIVDVSKKHLSLTVASSIKVLADGNPNLFEPVGLPL